MLKHKDCEKSDRNLYQPPSGGCVLKLIIMQKFYKFIKPAAFGRLCVETASKGSGIPLNFPAAFGRLCVETAIN